MTCIITAFKGFSEENIFQYVNLDFNVRITKSQPNFT